MYALIKASCNAHTHNTARNQTDTLREMPKKVQGQKRKGSQQTCALTSSPYFVERSSLSRSEAALIRPYQKK